MYGRRFAATGTALGEEFKANTYTAGDQAAPAVTALAGGFVVTWESAGQNGIYGQRYVPEPTVVAAVQVNGGAAQRSMVRSLTVTSSGPVTFAGGDANAAAAFALTRLTGGGGTVGLTATVATNGSGQTVVTLSFTNANPAVIDPQSILNEGVPSLADGRYRLSILDGAVTGPGGAALDGDGNGTAGGTYQSPEDTAGSGAGYVYGLYRLFGDATGNGVVDLLDLAAFRGTFNQTQTTPLNPLYLAYLDADNDGNVDLMDLQQFRSHFNLSLFA